MFVIHVWETLYLIGQLIAQLLVAHWKELSISEYINACCDFKIDVQFVYLYFN